MSYNKSTIVAFVLLVLLALGGWLLPVGNNQTVVERVVERLGSSPGPTRTNDCESRNDIEQCFRRGAMVAATTTPCVVRAPVHATSTLLNGMVRFTVASTTDSVITLAKATSYNATTTNLATTTITVSANTQATFQLPVNNDHTIADDRFVFSPGQYFVVGLMQTGAGSAQVAGLAPGGFCQATWEVI